MKLENKVAAITGAASGLGEATAKNLRDLGVKVALLDLNEEKGELLSAQLGQNAIFVKTDVTSEESVKNAVASTVSAFGAVHINCNFAGVVHAEKTVGKEFKPHSLEAFRKVVDINLIGTFNVLRLCAAQMSKQDVVTKDGGRGVIINTGSVAGFEGQMGQAAYASTKAAINGSTICFARDLASFGIRVNSVAPGLVHTPMFDSFPENVYQALESSVLNPQRLGQPSEIAKLVQSLIENDYINGECVRIDGGIRMQTR